MDIVNQYFANLVFTKVEHKEAYTVYAASVHSSFGDGRKQYVLAFVPTHVAIVDKARLSDLHWQNIQTRTLTNGYKLPGQTWAMPRGTNLLMFKLVNREVTLSRYVADDDLPLEMILLHDPKKKSVYQYHDKMNIVGALATFKCVISATNARTSVPLSSLPNTPAQTQAIEYSQPVRPGFAKAPQAMPFTSRPGVPTGSSRPGIENPATSPNPRFSTPMVRSPYQPPPRPVSSPLSFTPIPKGKPPARGQQDFELIPPAV